MIYLYDVSWRVIYIYIQYLKPPHSYRYTTVASKKLSVFTSWAKGVWNPDRFVRVVDIPLVDYPSLKLTAKAPENFIRLPRTCHLTTIDFSETFAVSFREDITLENLKHQQYPPSELLEKRSPIRSYIQKNGPSVRGWIFGFVGRKKTIQIRERPRYHDRSRSKMSKTTFWPLLDGVLHDSSFPPSTGARK